MSRRLPELEQRFLVAITGRAAPGRFGARVAARLDRVGERTGRDLPDITVRRALEEIREECEDVPGWSLMALHLARERGMPEQLQRQLREQLVRAGALALVIDELVDGLLEALAAAGD